jgi:hydroxymethylpyrimidine pyrophosphatase-like HAD family hydrolase
MIDYFDYAVRLLPGLAIVGGLVGARLQILENRRVAANTIAKNHYREFLELLLKNADIAYGGVNDESFSLLRKDPAKYRRYRMLFTNMVFAMQEMYFAMDIENNEHWKRTVINFITLFKCLIISDEEFPPSLRAGLHPAFVGFMMETASKQGHAMAVTTLGNPSK